MLEDEEFQSADIFVLPPDDPARSDEDSGPEDDDGVIDNLTGSQLRADAEATLTVSSIERRRVGLPSNDETTSDSDKDQEAVRPVAKRPRVEESMTAGGVRLRNNEVTTSAQDPTIARQKREPPPPRSWVKRDLKQPDLVWTASRPLVYNMELAPSSLFELFYDDEVIDHMTEMTDLYATQN